MEAEQGPRQSPAVMAPGSEDPALPVLRGAGQCTARARRDRGSRSWLGCPGVWGLMLPFRPTDEGAKTLRGVVPAPQAAEGASEQGRASGRSHAALLWGLCRGSCEVLCETFRRAWEREVGGLQGDRWPFLSAVSVASSGAVEGVTGGGCWKAEVCVQ